MWVLDSVFLLRFWVIVFGIITVGLLLESLLWSRDFVYCDIVLLNYLSVYSDYHGFKEEK